MRLSTRALFAAIGPALVAISLCGSTWRPGTDSLHDPAGNNNPFREGLRLYRNGDFTGASRMFQQAAALDARDGLPGPAALNWSNAGGAELAHLNFRAALPFFLKARTIAKESGLRVPLLAAANNLASLYLEMGDPESTVRVAREALNSVDLKKAMAEDQAGKNLGVVPKLKYQLAAGLSKLHRFEEARVVYREAIDGIAELGDLEETARVLGNFGSDCLDAGYLDDADAALSEGLRLVRLHQLDGAANILRPLAKLRSRQRDIRSAAALFDAAIDAPPDITTRWDLYTDRGEFRLSHDDLRGALADFHEARRVAAEMRADIVPADRDRVTLEGNLSRITTGLIEAGNRLAEETNNHSLLSATFDAAEQDRIWSLRALIPAENDWRSHLPPAYWDRLAHYQALERSMLETTSPALESQAAEVGAELRNMEAAAANEAHTAPPNGSASAMAHVQSVLDSDSVLFSFHLGATAGWVWAVDRNRAAVYRIPGREVLAPAIDEFTRAARKGEASLAARDLYRMLFGTVASGYLAHRRWLLEPDGRLYDLPFAALMVNDDFLFQRAAIETIPGALMLQPRQPFADGGFLGVGDAIYNTADSRYQGARGKPAVLLPRLTNTGEEIAACSREWRSSRTRLLTGSDANPDTLRVALASNPAVIHFATHIVSGTGPHASGMIALSLDPSASMRLVGPVEVTAHPIAPGLVVLNGCHSAEGETLPGVGLMGLTRAWIAAGARAVVATRWDIPDQEGAEMMIEFYRALRAAPAGGPVDALQQAQRKLLLAQQQEPAKRLNPAVWGAYFVLGRE